MTDTRPVDPRPHVTAAEIDAKLIRERDEREATEAARVAAGPPRPDLAAIEKHAAEYRAAAEREIKEGPAIRAREAALREYVANGGDAEQFDQHYPRILAERTAAETMRKSAQLARQYARKF